MATGQDFIDKYLKEQESKNDNYPYVYAPKEEEEPTNWENTKEEPEAEDNFPYVYAPEGEKSDNETTQEVEQKAKVTPEARKPAPSVKVEAPQIEKVDVSQYSRRPEYKIANGKIVGINRYVYTNDDKNYYTENGEKIEAYKNGDKTDMPILSPEEEVSARVKSVYDQFKDRIVNATEKDYGAIKNDLWNALKWNVDFSHYEDKDAESKLKDVAFSELGRQYLEQNPKARIKAEAFSPKYYRENLEKESEKENAEAGQLYVNPGADLYGLASGQNMQSHVNQRSIEATKWLNTETQWLINAAEGEAKRDKGFWSGLKGLGLGLVHGTRGVLHGGVNGGIEASVMAQVASAYSRMADGKTLTGDDERLMDAYINKCEAEQAYQDDLGYCYKLGQNTAISAPFMLEFIVNPLSGAGEAAIRGLSKKLIQRYGVDWVKQGVARLTNREVKAVMERSIRNYITDKAGKILTEKTAKVVGKYGAKAVGLGAYGASSTISSALMTATSGLPGVYADKVNRQLKDGESEGEAWRKATMSALNERGSEYAGPLFTPFLKTLSKTASKIGTSVVGKERLAALGTAMSKTLPIGATRELIHDIANLKSYKIMKDITKRAHWDGFFEEDFEEKFGSFMDAAFIGDQHFLDKDGNIDWTGDNSFFNLKERFDESVNVGFTTLLLGIGGASGYRTPKYRLANALKTYDTLGEQLYGDNWASFKATIESAKPEQLSSVLVGCMQAGASRQQMEVLANYAHTYAMLDASVELERGMRTSEDADKEQVDAEQSYDDGYTLEGQQRNDAKNRLGDAQKTASSLLHLENTDELDGAIGLNEDNSNAVEVMKGINARTDINDYAKQKLTEYVNAKLSYQGTIDAAKDDIESKVEISNRTIDNQANEDGMVQTATLKNGTAVYIRSGNVSIDSKSGEVISSESDGTLVVQDQVSGELQMIPSSDVLYLTSNQSAEELKTQAANNIRMEAAQQHAQEIDGTLPFNQGDVYNMEDKDGNPLQVQVVSDLGDGNVSVLFNGENATLPKSQLQTLNDNYNQKRLQVWKASQEQDTETKGIYDVANSLQNKIGSSLSEEEATNLTKELENRAEVAREMELTPENWALEFGEDGKVSTPLGGVKMGENQYLKLARLGRRGKLGMVKPTLENPDLIIEETSIANNGENTERNSSYIFVKTYKKSDGERIYHFTSVTVQKDGKEVVISNQEKSVNRIKNLMQEGTIIFVKGESSLHPITQMEESVPLNDSQSSTSSDNQTLGLGINSPELSNSKGTINDTDLQGNSVNSSENLSALSQIPVDENGVRQYTEALPATAYDALVEATGSREGADQVVEAEKAKAQKALDEALNRKPEGNTTDEIVASAREIFQAKQQAHNTYRHWNAVGKTMEVRSEMRRKGIDKAVNLALASHAMQEETEDIKRFNNLAETLPSLKGEERENVLAAMASIAEAYAKANGYDATICKTTDEYMQSPGITDDVRQQASKLGMLVPGHYYQGHVYINIEDMTKVNGVSASDMLSSTLLHESTHMDNATDEGGVMSHLKETLENGEVDIDEAQDIIEAISGTKDYRRQAKELQEKGKSPSELIADELMAHMLQAMSWGVPVESMTKNETLTNIINEANERREKVRTSGEEVSQRSESVDDVSRGQVQPSGAVATDNGTEQSGRGLRADGEREIKTDSQGNPLNDDGPLKVELDMQNVMSKPSGLTIGKSGKKAIDAYKFVARGKEELKKRPVFCGVRYENGVAIATDCHVMVAITTDYDKAYEGKTIYKSGAITEGAFPNWKSILPTAGERVDKDAFLHAVGEAKAWMTGKKEPFVYIAIPSSNGNVMIPYDSARKLADVISKAQNAETFIGKTSNGASVPTVTGDGVVALSMPILVDEELSEGKFFHVGGELGARLSIRNDNQRKAAENAYDFAKRNMPSEEWHYAIVNMERPGAIPEYAQKRDIARKNCSYYNELGWGNYKLFDLNKTFEDNLDYMTGLFPEEYSPFKTDEARNAKIAEYKKLKAEQEKLAAEYEGLYAKFSQSIKDYIANYMAENNLSDVADPEDVLRDARKEASKLYDSQFDDLSKRIDEVDNRLLNLRVNERSVRYSVKQKRALETVSVSLDEEHPQTVISSADGAKVLNNLDTLAKNYENSDHTKEKTFIGEVAKSLGATHHGSKSEYATFKTKNGKVVTIRLANHNAKVSNFDNKEESEGISIVVSPKENNGITNNGNAHIVEFFYDAIKLRRAEGKPLADIVRSIKQALYSGEFKDTTGLAERQEVNTNLQDEAKFSLKGNNVEKIGANIYRLTLPESNETKYMDSNGDLLHDVKFETVKGKRWYEGFHAPKDLKVRKVDGKYEVEYLFGTYDSLDDAVEQLGKIYDQSIFKKVGDGIQAEFQDKGIVKPAKIVKFVSQEQANTISMLTGKSLADIIKMDGKSDNIRFSLAGERGAANMDRAEEVTTRLDNLSVARSMEEEKKDAKAIKMATGWERGADGKWRYEIPDIEYVPTGDADLNRRVEMQPWGKEYTKLTDRMLDGETLTDAEMKRFEELSKKAEEVADLYKGLDKKSLADYVRADDLFKAYPELRAVNVVFVKRDATEGGSYSDKTNTIYVNENSSLPHEEVFAHEIQHAIQYKEGFARGGNEQMFHDPNEGDRLMAQFDKLIREKFGNNDIETLYGILDGTTDEYRDFVESLGEEYDGLLKSWRATKKYASAKLFKELYDRDVEEANKPSAYNQYRALAGEVEARNVQKRMGMNDGERRNSLASETEDVAREDQIFLGVDDTKYSLKQVNDKFNEEHPLGRVTPDLTDKEVEIVKADANHGFKNFGEAKSWAKDNIARTYDNEETGGKGNVRISNGAIGKYLSESAAGKSESKNVHLSILKVLPDVIRESIDAEQHPDFKKGADGIRTSQNGINPNVTIHRLYGAVQMGDDTYRVKVTLKEDSTSAEPKTPHSYEATKIELLAGTLGNSEIGLSPNTNNSISATKLLKDVEMSYNPGHKLLEESENLQDEARYSIRTYHGSGADFDEFDHNHMGEGEGAQAYGWGTYVTEVEGIGRTYATQNAAKHGNKYYYQGKRLYGSDGLIYDIAKDIAIKDCSAEEAIQNMIAVQEKRLKLYDEDNGLGKLMIPKIKYDIKRMRTLNPADFKVEKVSRNLYDVEIPDDTGKNYLDWNGKLPKKFLNRVNKALEAEGKNAIEQLFPSRVDGILRGEDLYDTLRSNLGSQEAASKLLSKAGFVGIKYPADNMRGGRADGAKNYVIFNEADAKIVDHTRFSVRQANERFNEELDAFKNKSHKGLMHLGQPSPILKACGVNVDEITLSPSVLHSHLKKHNLSTDDLKGLVMSMQNPILVYKHGQHSPNIVVVTELDVKGGKLSASLKLDSNGEVVEVSNISSIHSKDAETELERLYKVGEEEFRNSLRWVEKEKVLHWIAPSSYEPSGMQGNEAPFDITKVINDFENPKVADENLQNNVKFSIRNSSDLVNDISEKGLDGAVGKEAVSKFVDGLYMNDADIRREINKGITKAGFDYGKATRNFLSDIANGEVSPEIWHKVRTAFQGMLRENGINANLTDADIAYSLWKEANPGNDVISQAKDIAMQWDMGAGRFSLVGGPRAGMALDEYNRKALSSKLDWQEAWQDAMVSAKALQDAIAEETQSHITDSEDVYHAENRMYGASKNEVEYYEDNYLNPLLKEVSNVLEQSKKNGLGMDYKGLMDYLMAKHGLERNSFFAFKTRIAEEQQKRADQVTAQMKAQAEQDYQDALQKAGQLTGIDLLNAVKAANRAKAKADRLAEQTGIEEGRKLRDALYDGYVNDADLAQLKNDLRTKKITFRDFEMRKRDIMEKHVNGTIQMIEDQGDKAGLSNIMDDDTDFENLAFSFVDGIESRLTTDNLWKKINSATGNTLEKSYTSGRMTKKAYDYVNSMFDFYVPLRGWDETTADEVYEYENASRPVFTPAVKRMFGRKSKAEDPIAYIGNQAVSEISIGNKNLMKQYLLRLAQNHPTSALSVSEVWYENVGTHSKPQWVEVAPNITEGMSASDITAEMDRFKQDMEQKRNQGMAKRQSEKLSVGMPILPMQENEHRVDVMVDGQKYSIFVNGSPKAAQAINGTNKKNVDFHLGDNFISKTNRFISEVLTSKNPAFAPANFARDMLGAHSQIWTKEDAKYIWNFEKNVAKVITTPRRGGKIGVTGYMPELIRKWKADNLDMNNDIERYFAEFMKHGGETGYVNMLGVDKFKEEIQKKLDNFNGHYGKNAWNAVWGTVEFYNRAVEDATRFITYMTSREQGRSVDRAIDDAKTISLNFNRKGTGAKGNALLRKLVIFVNPAIQALDNQYKLISQHPGRYAAVIGSLILRGMAQSKLNELLINLLGDDDDKDSYYEIPEWTRRNNLVLWIPGTHNFFKIPLSQEFRMWYGLGETMQGIIDGKTKSNPAMELATSMMGLLPVDPSGNGGNPIANAMPTMMKPIYEVTENENFLGLPIYKDNQGNEYEPEFQRVSYGTPSWLTKASEGLNSLTGGDTHERGALEQWTAGNKYARLLTNPSVWNHLLSGYIGGPYNIISQSIGLGTDFVNGDGLTVGNTPIVSRFVARPSERSTAGKTSDMYRDLIKEAEETRSHYSHYKKDYEKALSNGDEEGAQKAMDKLNEITQSPDFLKMRTIEVYDSKIQKMRQVMNLYNDEESKKRYSNLMKQLEEQCLNQIESYDEDIKK